MNLGFETILFLCITVLVLLVSVISFYVINNGGNLRGLRAILFLLLFTLILSAAAFTVLIPGAAESMYVFYFIQAIAFGFGYLCYYLLRRNFIGELRREETSRLLYVTAIAMAGMIGFELIFNHYQHLGLAPYYSLSVFSFVLPQFIAVAFNAYVKIPQEIYKLWYFPEEKEIDFEKIDTTNVFVLELEFSKSVNDTHFVNSKAKAPVGMLFGDWFKSFIENYNTRFDNDPIQYMNQDNSPQGWMFYKKPSFLGTPQYIDPDLSISQNRINEKNVIIARRVGMDVE